MIHVGDIFSTVGVFSTMGDIIFCYLSTSMVLNTTMILKISPTFIIISSHGTEHPPRYLRSPHGTHDINHGTERLPWY